MTYNDRLPSNQTKLKEIETIYNCVQANYYYYYY